MDSLLEIPKLGLLVSDLRDGMGWDCGLFFTPFTSLAGRWA